MRVWIWQHKSTREALRVTLENASKKPLVERCSWTLEPSQGLPIVPGHAFSVDHSLYFALKALNNLHLIWFLIPDSMPCEMARRRLTCKQSTRRLRIPQAGPEHTEFIFSRPKAFQGCAAETAFSEIKSTRKKREKGNSFEASHPHRTCSKGCPAFCSVLPGNSPEC